MSRKNSGWRIAFRISCAALLVLTTVMLVHIGVGIATILQSPGTSFPWYSAFFFVGIGYLPFLLLLAGLCLFFYCKSRSTKSRSTRGRPE